MSYSALFTSGLSLASMPRTEAEAQAASRSPSLQLQINPPPGTQRPRLRKRRSSLTIATSPISAVKSPLRTANDSLRTALRSPREVSFIETLQNSVKPKSIRRKTVSSAPPLPAPTSPLPTLPVAYMDVHRPSLSSTPITPTGDPFPSSPVTSEPLDASRPAWMGPLNHSRKSSSLLPPVGRPRSSSANGRGPLAPSPYAGNMAGVRGVSPANDLDMRIVQEKPVIATAAASYDDDEEMKENGSEV